MNCPCCRESLPSGARYCPQCGALLEQLTSKKLEDSTKPRLDILLLSVLVSLGLTALLTLVFHLPVFIFGAFLPFFWIRRKSSS